MAADKVGLELEIKTAGMATGEKAAVRSLDEIKKAAGVASGSVDQFNGVLKGSKAQLDELTPHLGRAGSAISGLASALGSSAGPLAIIGAAIAASTMAIKKFIDVTTEAVRQAAAQEQAFVQLEAGIRSTGGAAGRTSEQLSEMAGSLQKVSTAADDDIMRAQSVLLTFTRLVGSEFDRATQSVLDMSARLGMDLNSAAIQVGKALNDPILGVSMLSRAGVQFTAAQKEMIKSLTDAGDLVGAQNIVLKELETQFGGSAAAARDTFGGAMTALQNAVSDLYEEFGDKLLPTLKELAELFVSIASDEMTIAFVRGLGDAFKVALAPLRQFVQNMREAGSVIAEVKKAFNASAGGQMFNLLTNAEAGSGVVGSGARTRTVIDAERRAKSAAAADAWATGMEDWQKNYEKVRKRLFDHADQFAAEMERETERRKREMEALAESMKQRFIAPLEVSRESPLDGYFDKAEKSATRIGSLLRELGVRTRDWAGEADMVRKAYASGEITLAEMEAALKRIGNLSVDWKSTEPPESVLSNINKGFSEAVGAGLHDAAFGFLQEMTDGLTDGLPSSVKPLADALVSAANEWLTQMLANIAKAAAAATAAKIGEGGKGGSGDSWMSLFKGGLGMTGTTGAMGGAAIGGLAFAAVAVAALAIMKHQSDQRDKRRYGTNVGMRTEDGAFYGYMGGRLQETGGKMRDAMVQLAAELQDSTRVLLSGTASAIISIRNDKKAFEAKLNGELIGVFRSAEEAVIAVIKTQFLRQESLDPVIRQVMENYRGKDPEELAANVRYVQGIIDAVSGLTEMEATLQKLPAQIAAMVGNLKQMGVAMADAQVLAGRWGVDQFRGAWDQISGKQRSPKEEMEMRERQKALLLAQMALEKARLAGEIAALKARMKIAAAGTQFQQRDLAARIHLVKWEANALRNGLDIYGNYVNGRAQLAQIEAGVYDEQLKAMELVMQELDKLMGEVERGKISLGGVGKGKGVDTEPVKINTSGEWHRRLLSAIENLRDYQKRLVFGENSPFTGRQKVDAARSEVDRVMAMYQSGGRQRTLAVEQMPEVFDQYLSLFRETFGSSGAYETEARRINDIVSRILSQNGVAPITVMQEQARANADEMRRIFARDGRGKLHTRNEELEERIERTNLFAERTARDTSRVAEAVEDLAVNIRASAAGSSVAPPPQQRFRQAG